MDRYRDSVMPRPQVLVLWLLCVRSFVEHNLDAVVLSGGLAAKIPSPSSAIIRLTERMSVRANVCSTLHPKLVCACDSRGAASLSV